MPGLGQILIFLLLWITFGYLTGTYHERRHYKSIRKRERETLYLPIVTVGAKQPLPEATETKLLVEAVVISVDPFKRASAAMRHMLGGCVIVYETLLDRGRREALLRLKRQGIEWGATQILNVRFQTVTISGESGNRKVGTVEVIAYGTGIKPSTNYTPKQPREEINISPKNYLLDFFHSLLIIGIVGVLTFLALGWIAELMVTRISMDTEKKIVQWLPRTPLANEIPSGDKRIPDLEQLLARLSKTKAINREPVKIHVLDDSQLPDKKCPATMLREEEMVVCTSLLNAVHSENELAFVLAHELGHLKNRDVLKTLGRTLVFLFTVGVELNWDTGSWLSSLIIHETGNVTGGHYDRKQESAADEEGLAVVVEYYGHGGHALDYFEEQLKKEKEKKPSWLTVLYNQYISDHPTLSDRIAHLQQVAKNQKWKMEGELTPLPSPSPW